MGIKADIAYRGITIQNVYLRITNVMLADKKWTALIWGFKNRAAALADPISPAFTINVKTLYVKGSDPIALLYAAAHVHPDLSNVTDVLTDPPDEV